MKIARVGTIALQLTSWVVRKLKQVQYIPRLAHNLLCIGQQLGFGYIVVFTNEECIIKDEGTGFMVAHMEMSKHRLFPLSMDEVGATHVALGKKENSML